MEDLINTHFINKTNKKLNTKIDEVWEFLKYMGGFEKFIIAGQYSFIVPPKIETIYVSAVGGGAGGAGGGGACNYSSTIKNGGAGGGGGGRGTQVINQEITVTPGETLTIIVGEKGLGGTAGVTGTDANYAKNGGDRTDGEDTILKRGSTVLLTAQKGTRGFGGNKGKNVNASVSGGRGGELDGKQGEDSYKYSSDSSYPYPGNGGKGGQSGVFGGYGNGGEGGQGARADSTIEAHPGIDGTEGALVICFGGYRLKDINW